MIVPQNPFKVAEMHMEWRDVVKACRLSKAHASG